MAPNPPLRVRFPHIQMKRSEKQACSRDATESCRQALTSAPAPSPEAVRTPQRLQFVTDCELNPFLSFFLSLQI
jgi:hypothetical protein